MTVRLLLTACLLALFSGAICGWSARAITADHRYIRALAARHEAVAGYYLQQSDQLIQNNKNIIAKGKKYDGSKEN